MTQEQIEWLREQIKTTHPRILAKQVGCCKDTLMRVLDEHDILPAQSSKHIRRKPNSPKWERPCLRCKCTKPRDKNQYVCDKCKRRSGSETDGIPDEYLIL